MARTHTEIVPRIKLRNDRKVQYSVHKPNKFLLKELELILPEASIASLYIVPMFWQSHLDLTMINDETTKERNELLAMEFRKKAVEHGYWADVTDPASGYPVYSKRGSTIYPDVEGCVALLKYRTEHVGFCNILLHPIWQARNYPFTMFTNCPPQIVETFMSELTR